MLVPDVWACASETAEAAQAKATRIVLVILFLRGLSDGDQHMARGDVARQLLG
jgi:hypothetical protein